MSRLSKKMENKQIDDLVVMKMPKDDMLKLLEKAKDEDPELFNQLVKGIKNFYSDGDNE